jgi:hypothetical protein
MPYKNKPRPYKKKPLSKGGSNKDGVKVQSRKKNRAAGGALSRGKRKK